VGSTLKVNGRVRFLPQDFDPEEKPMKKSDADRMAEWICQGARANEMLAWRARRLSFIGGLAVGVLVLVACGAAR
jgi:hypothetical protein